MEEKGPEMSMIITKKVRVAKAFRLNYSFIEAKNQEIA